MIALAALAVTIGVVGALAAAGLYARRRWMVVTVRGHSMTPTLHNGERLLVRRWPRGAMPGVGDVKARIAEPLRQIDGRRPKVVDERR